MGQFHSMGQFHISYGASLSQRVKVCTDGLWSHDEDGLGAHIWQYSLKSFSPEPKD